MSRSGGAAASLVRELVNTAYRLPWQLRTKHRSGTMNELNVLNLVLWSVQGFLALFFLAAGAPKIIGRGLERWTGFSDLPRPLVISIGLAEVLGAAGLVLPMASGILPWLTPLAAIGLAVIVLM